MIINHWVPTPRDYDRGDWIHRCDECQRRFSGPKAVKRCAVCSVGTKSERIIAALLRHGPMTRVQIAVHVIIRDVNLSYQLLRMAKRGALDALRTGDLRAGHRITWSVPGKPSLSNSEPKGF